MINWNCKKVPATNNKKNGKILELELQKALQNMGFRKKFGIGIAKKFRHQENGKIFGIPIPKSIPKTITKWNFK